MLNPLRHAARGLVIDREQRIFLFRAHAQDKRPWWFTPGGAVEPGETHEQALARELKEEIGLALSDEEYPLIWIRESDFRWRNRLEHHVEQFFLVRVEAPELDFSGMEEEETSELDAHRWWTLAEIQGSAETFAPLQLADLLPPLLRGEMPETPLHIFD